MKIKTMLTLALFSLFFSSCVVIRPGEVGVKQRLGKISNEALSEGPRGYNPFTTSIVTLPTRTVNLEIKSNLPSKEGLTITSVMRLSCRFSVRQRRMSAPVFWPRICTRANAQ